MGVTSIEFAIEGQKSLVPDEWQEISLFFTWGQFSNQPLVASRTFTFYGDSAKIIYDKYKKGYILRGIDVSLIARQEIEGKEYSVDLFKDFIINLSKGITLNEPDFNNTESPLSVTVTIEKKRGINTIIERLRGLNFTFLDSQGYINNSDYTTVKTAIQPIYNASDIALALVSIYLLVVQIRNLIEDTIDFVSQSISDLTGTDVVRTAAKIIYIAVVVLIRAATAVILIGALVTLIVDLISLLVPPIVKNKAMTWRKGLEIIFSYLGYGFVSNLEELDIEVILPSKPYSNETNIIKDAFPNFVASTKGYPHPSDFGHNAQEYIELAQKRFNAKFDIVGSNVTLKWNGDKSLFKQSTYTPHLDINREKLETNITDIPNLRSYKFLTDENDGYTTENYRGTAFYVVNESKFEPFKGRIDTIINLALGSSKTKLSLIEKRMKVLAETADNLVNLFGGNSNLAGKIKSRVNVLKVSSNEYQVAKLIPIINGQMPKNHREITSAKAVENKYYYNESIERGTGQKLIINNWENPFNLKDSEDLTNNGKFIDSKGNNVRMIELEYTSSEDIIKGALEVDYNYIAKSDFKEVLIETQI